MTLKYSVIVPIGLITYLNEKVKLVDSASATRWMALEDLVKRYLIYKTMDDDMAINFQQLSEAWKWGRPKTIRFLQRLQQEGIISIDTVVNNKVVRLCPEVILSSQITDPQAHESTQSINGTDHPIPSLTEVRSSPNV